MTEEYIYHFIQLGALAFIQNVSFSMVSRSRNRDSMVYLIWASIFSNTLWFLCMRELVKADLSVSVLPAYLIGTVAGSVYGAKISMFIEKRIGARADAHLKEDGNK